MKALAPGRPWLFNLPELELYSHSMVTIRIRGEKNKNQTQKQPPVVILKGREEIHQPHNFIFYFQNAFFPPMISSAPSWPREEGRKE